MLAGAESTMQRLADLLQDDAAGNPEQRATSGCSHATRRLTAQGSAHALQAARRRQLSPCPRPARARCDACLPRASQVHSVSYFCDRPAGAVHRDPAFARS